MCVEFRIFGIPFVEVISDQKMNVSFETTLVYNIAVATLLALSIEIENT
jgi:hypothetical protein